MYANDAYKAQIPKEKFSQELVKTSTEKILGPVVNINGIQTLSFKDPHGLIIQIDNGDTQYLTTEEYKLFLKNREKIDNSSK